MKIDIGEVFSRSWQISWTNKWLWLIGALMMLVSLMFFPVFLIPMVAEAANVNIDENIVLLLFLGSGILFFIVVFPLSSLLNAALTQGIVQAERGEGRRPFMELVRASYPFFWRYLGVTVLFVGAILLFFFGVSILMILLSTLTFGLGMLCMMPFSFLQYPLMLVWYVCMEQALTAIIVDNMTVMDATKHSWWLFRNNIFAYVIIAIVFYFGVGMLSSFVIMPFMFPFFFLPMAAMESSELARILLILGSVLAVVLLPFFCFFQGGVMTLMKSSWVITYLRLSQASNSPQVIPQEVPAS